MNQNLSKTLSRMVADTQKEIAADKREESLGTLKIKLAKAPAVISFHDALRTGFGLIAEIKQRSPSAGSMNENNVGRAPDIYKRSAIVRAVSVLTNRSHFGKKMTLKNLLKIKTTVQKPVLRKDFILDEYQVYQARAYGADAILLMANILEQDELHRLFDLAKELGMDVLFETHEESEIKKIPSDAKIYGINCRNFDSDGKTFAISAWLNRTFGWSLLKKDLTTNLSRFSYCGKLPSHSIKVAESGVKPEQAATLREAGFNALLVGTVLLKGKEPVAGVLGRFEKALQPNRELNVELQHAHA